MLIPEVKLRHLICEALTKTDKDEIARISRREIRDLFKDEYMKKMEKEIESVLKSKNYEKDIVDLVKKVMIKVYKELSFNQPHIIRQVRV